MLINCEPIPPKMPDYISRALYGQNINFIYYTVSPKPAKRSYMPNKTLRLYLYNHIFILVPGTKEPLFLYFSRPDKQFYFPPRFPTTWPPSTRGRWPPLASSSWSTGTRWSGMSTTGPCTDPSRRQPGSSRPIPARTSPWPAAPSTSSWARCCCWSASAPSRTPAT